MAVQAYALTTRDRLKAFLGLTSTTSAQDTLLDVIINSVTTYIENYIGFRVKKTTYTNEVVDTDNDSIILKRGPITGAVSISRRNSGLNDDSWETIDSNLYFVDTDAGIIRGAGGYKFGNSRQGYRVTYTAGYDFDNTTSYLGDTEAADLEMAAWMLAAAMWNLKGGSGGVKSESIGDYSVVYQTSVLNTPELQDILDKYAGIPLGASQTPFVY